MVKTSVILNARTNYLPIMYGCTNVSNGTALEYYVITDDGDPHLYIHKINGMKDYIIRLNLLKNEYIREDDDTNASLDEIEKRYLYEYLLDKLGDTNSLTVYRYYCNIWNELNPDNQIEDVYNRNTPEYFDIYEPIKEDESNEERN